MYKKFQQISILILGIMTLAGLGLEHASACSVTFGPCNTNSDCCSGLQCQTDVKNGPYCMF